MYHDIEKSNTSDRQRGAIIGGIVYALEAYQAHPVRSQEIMLLNARRLLSNTYGPTSLKHPYALEFEGIFVHIFEQTSRLLNEKDIGIMSLAERCWKETNREQRLDMVEMFIEKINETEFQRMFGAGEESPDETERIEKIAAEMAQYAFSSALYSSVMDYPDNFVEEDVLLEAASGYVLQRLTKEHFDAGALLQYLPFQDQFQKTFTEFYRLFRQYLKDNTERFQEVVPLVRKAKIPYSGIRLAVGWMKMNLPASDTLFQILQLHQATWGEHILPPLTAENSEIEYLFNLPEELPQFRALLVGHLLYALYKHPALSQKPEEELHAFFRTTYSEFKKSMEETYATSRKFTNDEVLARTAFVTESVALCQEASSYLQPHRPLQAFFTMLHALSEEEVFEQCVTITRTLKKGSNNPLKDIEQAIALRFDNDDVELWNPESGKPSKCLYPGCKNDGYPLIKIIIDNPPFDMYIQACDMHREALDARCTKEQLQYVVKTSLKKMHLPDTLKYRIVRYNKPEKPNSRYMKERQLLERYRLRNRDECFKLALFRNIEPHFGERAKLFATAYLDAEVDLAKKYIFAPSAIALLEYLPGLSFEQAIKTSLESDQRLWIRFEQPLALPHGEVHALSFGAKTPDALKYAQERYPLSQKKLEDIASYLEDDRLLSECALDAIAVDGKVLWTQALIQMKDTPGWSNLQPSTIKICGNDECLQRDDFLCDTCLATNTLYWSLYANALKLIHGEIAEEDPDVHQKVLQEKKEIAIRREPDKAKPWKSKEHSITHSYAIITFNALVKKPATKEDQIRVSRGSWKAQIDPEQLVYWKEIIHLPEGRKLKHPRYWNMIREQGVDPEDPSFDGYVIEVKDHPRNQPMKLETLRMKMTRVVAEKPGQKKQQ